MLNPNDPDLIAGYVPSDDDLLVRYARRKKNSRPKIYISGPMTGIKDHNFPAFNATSDRLRALGFRVENPADKGKIDGWEWHDYLRYDIGKLIKCDGIFMLRGWRLSKGGSFEYEIAKNLQMIIMGDPGSLR